MSASATRPLPERDVAERHPPVRGARPPDFSAVALQVLREALEPLSGNARRWLERGDRAALDAAGGLFDEARDVLRMLARPATARVAQEAGDLVNAIAADLPAAPPGIGPEDVARVLVDGCAAVQEAVARLLRPDASDSAIAHVALFNDMRAVRGEALVSDALVLALGIAVPDESLAPAVDADAVRATGLARALLDWFRASNAEDEEAVRDTIGAVVDALDALESRASAAPGSRPDGQRDALAAARVVGDALARGSLADGGAVRRLFAELERTLSGALSGGGPGLLANLLYYVATIDDAAPGGETVGATGAAREERVRLVRRYDLGRVRAAAREVDARRAAAAGPGLPLLADFRVRLADELEPLRDWLARGRDRGGERRGGRLGARLDETVPALELVGAGRSAATMRQLVTALDVERPGGDPETRRLALAETLLELDARLDDELTGPVAAAAAPAVEPTLASRLRSIGARDRGRSGARDGEARPEAIAGDAAAGEAKGACIDEARRRVGDAGDAIERALEEAAARANARAGGEGAHLVGELRVVADALAILPLPEASALVDGLASVLSETLERPAAPETLERMGDLAAAVHFYLDAVSHPGPASAELLVTGEDAIAALRRSGDADDATGEGPGVVSDGEARDAGGGGRRTQGVAAATRPTANPTAKLSARDAQAMTVGALDALDRIGTALAGERVGAGQLAVLGEEFDRLRSIGETTGATELERVASAAGRAVAGARGGADAGDDVGSDALEPLRETWAVLPQLIEPLAGGDAGGVPVRGLERLLEALDRGARAGAVADRTSELDGTLREVFVDECTGHLDLLERAARESLADGPALPDESALRALHTLTGSAQTVDAVSIIELVRPLQRTAVELHRAGESFGDEQTRELLDTIDELRRRLEAFAATPERPPEESSLDRIFEDEATDLLERLAAVRVRAPGTVEEHATALGVLHTLKGGARAAGRDALAERAHGLEAELRTLAPGRAAHAAIARVARDVTTELDRSRAEEAARSVPGDATRADAPVPVPADATPSAGPSAVVPAIPEDDIEAVCDAAPGAASGVPSAAPPRDAGVRPPAAALVREDHVTRVPEARYERLLTLAADVVAGQARLQSDLERLDAAARELELAAQRWRRLPDASLVLESAAARELVDDVATVRAALGEALRTADTDGRRTARAGHALQQELVRARLQRLSQMTARLGRVVEDAALQSRRRARFELVGGETSIDGSLARELLPALEHLVRNAVVHGIETEGVRELAGKAPTGSVRVDVRIDGTELVVGVEDDGAGLDLDAVERRRVALGLPESPELLDTLAAPGLSTLESSDVIGGHGLGIGAARGLVERAGGRLHVGARDVGTRFELRVPQRVPVQQVLLLRAGVDVALPVNCVREVREADTEPSVSLAALLGEPSPGPSTHAVLLERDGRTRAIGVEAVEGYRELVVQPLGAQLGSLGRFTGGSALADGRVVLLLDPARVFDDAGEGAPGGASGEATGGASGRIGRGGSPPGSSAPAAREPAPHRADGLDARGRPEALVVDDSPTQRAWLSTLLGRAGFAVSIARDGVEALEFLARRQPQVMLADIDMPRLDGHGLLRALARRRAARRSADAGGGGDPPVLVVTSRDSPSDREAALENGAAAFLSKPCDERTLRDALHGCGVHVPDITVS